MSEGPGIITRHLLEWRTGDPRALHNLTSAVYAELRRLAACVLQARAGLDSIDPTELVHELFLELPALQQLDIESRAHFLNLSARVMRSILIDHARKRLAARRGGQLVAPGDSVPTGRTRELDVLVVDEVLGRFAEKYPREAQVVELRFFGGLTAGETAEALSTPDAGVSLRSVERDWTFARAWLHNALATH